MVHLMTDHNVTSRRAFLDRRRVAARAAFDDGASRYDLVWGDSGTSHLRAVADLVQATPPGGEILDAACGTGRYWEILAASGRSVFGIDQSAGMLDVAQAKHPGVPYRELALQDLVTATDLHARFHGLMCVDAMEWVGREDWPVVLDGFHRVLRPGGWAYLAIEIPEDKDIELLAGPIPEEQVRGEIVGDGGFYAYFPQAEEIADWLAEAGFSAHSEHSGDGYRHLLLQSTASPNAR